MVSFPRCDEFKAADGRRDRDCWQFPSDSPKISSAVSTTNRHFDWSADQVDNVQFNSRCFTQSSLWIFYIVHCHARRAMMTCWRDKLNKNAKHEGEKVSGSPEQFRRVTDAVWWVYRRCAFRRRLSSKIDMIEVGKNTSSMENKNIYIYIWIE